MFGEERNAVTETMRKRNNRETIYIYVADYATRVTDSRAYPERNGPPDPKTPEKGSALLSSTTSFLWRPHQQSLVHWAYKSPQLSGLPEPHVLSDVITRWSFVPQDNSLSTRMFPSTSTRVTGLAEENTLLKKFSLFFKQEFLKI